MSNKTTFEEFFHEFLEILDEFYPISSYFDGTEFVIELKTDDLEIPYVIGINNPKSMKDIYYAIEKKEEDYDPDVVAAKFFLEDHNNEIDFHLHLRLEDVLEDTQELKSRLCDIEEETLVLAKEENGGDLYD